MTAILPFWPRLRAISLYPSRVPRCPGDRFDRAHRVGGCCRRGFCWSC